MDFRVVHLILTDANQCSQIAPLCGPSTVLLFCSGKQKFAGDSIDLFEKNVKRLFFWWTTIFLGRLFFWWRRLFFWWQPVYLI